MSSECAVPPHSESKLVAGCIKKKIEFLLVITVSRLLYMFPNGTRMWLAPTLALFLTDVNSLYDAFTLCI